MQPIYVDKNKPTILVLTDSAVQHTGLALVARNIFKRIHQAGKYNILQIGWFHNEIMEQVPWPIIPTIMTKRGADKEDLYGQKTLNTVLDQTPVDILWIMGDPFNIGWIADHPRRKSFRLVPYICVDSLPMHHSWESLFMRSDECVLFSEYGYNAAKAAYDISAEIIPHGVDLEVYKPLPKPEISRLKSSIQQNREDVTIIGSVGRNMPRKNLALLVPVLRNLIKGEYIHCSRCGKYSGWGFDLLTRQSIKQSVCDHCGSEDTQVGNEHPNLVWYYFGALNDIAGWDLPGLMDMYGIKPNFFCNPELRPTMGKPEHTMNLVYNSFDMFVLPTTAEGWGLPILEAMACGIPQVLPNNSAYLDFVGDGALLCDFETTIEPIYSFHRAVVKKNSLLGAIKTLADNKDLRERMGGKARKAAERYNWDSIAAQWATLFDRLVTTRNKTQWNQGDMV